MEVHDLIDVVQIELSDWTIYDWDITFQDIRKSATSYSIMAYVLQRIIIRHCTAPGMELYNARTEVTSDWIFRQMSPQFVS